MIGALFRLVFRGFALMFLAACAFGVYHLYRSGNLPLVEKALTDTTVAGSVKAAIAIHRDLSRRDLSVSAEDGTVKLRGRVASEAEKEAALELAASVDGVDHVDSAIEVDPGLPAVGGEKGSRSIGERLDDVALLAKVRAALHLDREARKLDLEISVASGSVAVSGRVPDAALRERILNRLESIDGVVAVSNDLEVR